LNINALIIRSAQIFRCDDLFLLQFFHIFAQLLQKINLQYGKEQTT